MIPTETESNATKLPDNNGAAPQPEAPPLKARDTKGVKKSK
jgi:hypothetical protein